MIFLEFFGINIAAKILGFIIQIVIRYLFFHKFAHLL